jgi:hypothetical protein
MTMFIFEGKIFDINLPQVVGENQYPAGWFVDEAARLLCGIESGVDVGPPPFNPLTQASLPLPPIRVDGTWTQQWQIVSLDSTTIAQNVSAQKLEQGAAIQAHLDNYARSWGYDNIVSACTYIGDPCAKFAAEGEALRAWRSAVWQYVESVAAAIEAGSMQPPASVDAALSLIPPDPVRPV